MTSSSSDSIQRRLDDIENYQIPNLRALQASTEAEHGEAVSSIKEEFATLQRDLEELELLADESETEGERVQILRSLNNHNAFLSSLRIKFRAAALTSKRRLDSQTAFSRRNDLLKSSAATSKVVKEQTTGSSDDALMSATSDVTDNLRQTMQMMQQELDRSVLSNQMLEQSSATLRLTNEHYSTLSIFLNSSKALITSLEQADTMDRLLMGAALLFFALVCLFIIKRRILDRGLRIMNVLVGRGSKNKKRDILNAVTSSILPSESSAALAEIATGLSTLLTSSLLATSSLSASIASMKATAVPSMASVASEAGGDLLSTISASLHSITSSNDLQSTAPISATSETLEDIAREDVPVSAEHLQETTPSHQVEVETSTTASTAEQAAVPSPTSSLLFEIASVDAPPAASPEEELQDPSPTISVEKQSINSSLPLIPQEDDLTVAEIIQQSEEENAMDEALDAELERARKDFEAAEMRMSELRKKARASGNQHKGRLVHEEL